MGSDSSVGKSIGNFWESISNPVYNAVSSAAQPKPQAPPAPPTQAQTNQTALNNQLQTERQMRASSTIFTPPAGVIDKPTLASAVLLGS